MSFIAMNRFSVNPGRSDEFEEHWRKRESYLVEVSGFLRFALLRGEEGQYISHSTWESRQAFDAWTESEAFRKAHSQARTPQGVLAGPPRIGLFEAVIEE